MIKIPILKNIKFFFIRTIKQKFFYFLSNSLNPISDIYGLDRGEAIDRFYIDNFLFKNKNLIIGHCLELLNNDYSIKYGEERIIKSDILDIDKNNKKANIIGDLKNLKNIIDDETYDCIILTQVLQFIDDYDSALSECKRILKTGGHILITAPSVSRIDCMSGVVGDFWRFTKASFEYILKNKFKKIDIESYGNAKIGMSFWIGLSQQDIKRSHYKYNDPSFPILITAIVEK